MKKEDYRKYLSVDNGRGILLTQNDAFILDNYGIDYKSYSSISDLILVIGHFMDEHLDEDMDGLEAVLEHLLEVYYYSQVKK